MINISKAIIFSIAVLGLSLVVFPAAAQIEPVTGRCGFVDCGKKGGQTIGNIDFILTGYVTAATALIITIATMFLIYAGFKYIMSGGNEEASAQAKRQILYAIIGIAVGGNAFLLASSFSRIDPRPTGAILIGFINAATFLAATVAGAFIVYSGYQYITAAGNEEGTTKAKRQLIYAVVGLLVVGLAKLIVVTTNIVRQGGQPAGLVIALRNVVNGLLLFASVIAGAFVIYGGYKYISSQGSEESVEGAKRTLIYAIIGIIVIALSAAIVNFFLNASGVL